MKGDVLAVDGDRALISGEDGQRYTFGPAAWRSNAPPVAGMAVDFVATDGAAADIYLEAVVDEDPPVVGTPSDGRLIPRLKSLMLQPQVEWQAIAAEEMSPGRLLGKTALLAAIAFLIVGLQAGTFFFLIFAFAPSSDPGSAPLGPLTGLAIGGAVLIGFLLFGTISAVVRVLVEGLVAKVAGGAFEGHGDFRSGLKLATYASTPMWLAAMVPIVGIFLQWLGAIYAIYLLYLGSGPVMRVPRAKRGWYTAITVVGSWFAATILFFAVYMIVNVGIFALFAAFGVGAATIGGVGKP